MLYTEGHVFPEYWRNSTWNVGFIFLWQYYETRFSLFYNTKAKHERHEWDTSDMSATRTMLVLHETVIAKLEVYSIQIDALRLAYDFLWNRKQRVKLNETFSSWRDIESGVPQGSILGLLFFNIHLCDLFYVLDKVNIASHAGDTTLFTVKENRVLLMH